MYVLIQSLVDLQRNCQEISHWNASWHAYYFEEIMATGWNMRSNTRKGLWREHLGNVFDPALCLVFRHFDIDGVLPRFYGYRIKAHTGPTSFS